MARQGFKTLYLFFAVILLCGLLSPSVYYIQVLSQAALWAIPAVGLNLLLGGTGQISLGQAGFMGVGAYTSAALLKIAGWPFAAAFIAAGLLCGLCGLFVGYAALRLRGHYLAMATLAFGGIIFGLLMEFEFLGGPMGLLQIPSMSLFGFTVRTPWQKYFVLWGAVALVTFLAIRLIHSRVGRALAAIREDEVAASAIGINVPSYKIRMFALSAVLSGLAGSMYASYLRGIVPARFSIAESVALLIMVTVGGLGSITGTLLAAVVLTVLPEFGRAYEDYRLTAYGAVLILLIILFPGGLGQLMQKAEEFLDRIIARLTRTPKPASDRRAGGG